MIRMVLLPLTGSEPAEARVARRLNRRIRRLQRRGHCVLVDCEGVEMPEAFLEALLHRTDSERIRVCGLPLHLQQRWLPFLTT